jgi:FtsP/CotA-like multicopper oxidase with cupredoxin domain
MRIAVPGSFFIIWVAAFYGPMTSASFASTGMPAARANDNRAGAGRFAGDELRVSLDARMAVWHPDGDDGPGIPIQAFAEAGNVPQIPGPLIRVPLGTVVVANVRNEIPGTTLTMHGMVDRPAIRDRAVAVPFGTTRVIRFRAGSPGTYLYWGSTTGKAIGDRFGWDSQLGGAFVVDSSKSKTAPDDRVFVISQWINVRDASGGPDFAYELDTINGRAWPHTERLSYAKNARVRWRFINASISGHPLHLHGYFFSVDSRGNGIADNVYATDADRDRKVTELVEPGSTFTMTWHADRPGNWLFHCHLPYHTVGHVPISAMLAGKPALGNAQDAAFLRHAGMGGLILALTVRAPHAEAPAAAPPAGRHVTLKIERAPGDRPDAPSFRYVVGDGGGTPPQDTAQPPIVLTRGVPYAIDITNLLNEPTSVHWHGLELADSYYDGVAGFSGYGSRVAPMIDPGQTFEARITPTRAGTFLYHTHMDDIWQLRGGLAAPLIVLEPGTTFDPRSDHLFTITTTHAGSLKIFVNGTSAPAPIVCRAGVAQRFRFINMTTFWTNAIVSLVQANRTVQWRPAAVDGYNLPATRRAPEAAVTMVTIGETRDYTFTPAAPGDLQLQFLPDPSVPNVVTVPIHVVQTDDGAL